VDDPVSDRTEPRRTVDFVPAQLAAYGRFSFDPLHSDIDPLSVWPELVEPHLARATADPTGFCRDLAAVAEPLGGWTVFGAQRLVAELLGGGCTDEAYLAMQDAALIWLHGAELPPARLSVHERKRWSRLRDSG
jgi:hypothetical protein